MQQTALRTSLLLAALPCLVGWVTTSQSRFGAQVSDIAAEMEGLSPVTDPRLRLGYLWNYPIDTNSDAGLGQSITWAWDPAMCKKIFPTFMESFWFIDMITCDSLVASLHQIDYTVLVSLELSVYRYRRRTV